MHELITLQLGPLANHAAAHFWNAQCVDARASTASLLFRESPSQGALPRTVIVDFRDAMGAVGAASSADPSDPDVVTWPTTQLDTSAYASAAAAHASAQSQYHQLLASQDDDEQHKRSGLDPSRIRAWADYLHPYLDPLSLAPLTRPLAFGNPACGADLLTSDWLNDTLLDTHLRHFLEDADHPSGMHVLADSVGGWAGVTSGVLTAVADTVPKLPFIVHSFASAHDPRAIASVVSGLVGELGEGALVHNVIAVPDDVKTAGDMYLGMAQVSPLIDLTLAPLRLGEWRAADITGLLGGAVPGCALVRAGLWMPSLSRAVRKGLAVFPQSDKAWFDFGVQLQEEKEQRPDAQVWLHSGSSASGDGGPEYVQRTERAVKWVKVDDARVAYPRVMPYPYTAAADDDEEEEEVANQLQDESVVVQYEAGAKRMQGMVQWMAKAVKREDADMYEALVGMVEHATDGDEDQYLY